MQGMEEREPSIARLTRQRRQGNKLLAAHFTMVCDTPQGWDPVDKTCSSKQLGGTSESTDWFQFWLCHFLEQLLGLSLPPSCLLKMK